MRVNAIFTPTRSYAGQPEAFARRLSALIPLGRMALHEYNATGVFRLSDTLS